MKLRTSIMPYLFTAHCSLFTADKAVDLTKMAVARVRHLHPLESETVALTKRTMVIGGGVAGIQASLDLADATGLCL